MKALLRGSGTAVLLSITLSAVAGGQIAFNPSKLLLQGGVAHANQAFEAKTGVHVAMPDDPNGIGISSTAYEPVAGVRFVRLDGVVPTQDSLSSDAYPVVRFLYVVTKGYPSGTTKEYIDFLRSAEGQALLAKEGRLGRI